MRVLVVILLVASLAGCTKSDFDWPEVANPGDALSYRDDLGLANITNDMEGSPVLMIPIPDGSGRLAIVTQPGVVFAYDGEVHATPYLDLTDVVGNCHFEQGLLGMAFSPTYNDDHRVFLTYTDKPCHDKPLQKDRKGDVLLVRLNAPPNATSLDPSGAVELFRVHEPYRNHNGGHILFGPDGYLYMGIGDGGDHGDPGNHAQDLNNDLGTIARLNVSGDGYTIPEDNPFVGTEYRHEIYLYGLRNPWRFDFDSLTGDLWISDVGQNTVEEVSVVRPDQAGSNMGWDVYEGASLHEDKEIGDVVWPVFQYLHEDGKCSVTGGPFLRNTTYPGLEGAYLFADFCSGTLWAYHENGTVETVMETGLQITGFGWDDEGGVYLMHWGGAIRKLVVLEEGQF